MRICIITPTSSIGWGGGITTHLRNVVRGFVEGKQNVTILSGTQEESGSIENVIEGASVEPVLGVRGDTFNPRFWRASRALFDKLHKENPFDIVLSEGSSAFGLLQKEPVRVPIVALLHQFKIIHLFNSSLEIDNLRTLGVYCLKTVPRIFYDAIFREIPFYRRCDGIICGAEHISIRLKKYYGVKTDKIKVIPYWIDNRRFQSDKALRASGRKLLNVPPNGFIFLILGRIQKTKGILVGLKAFAQIVADNPNLYLVVAGGGNLQLLNEYRYMAEKLKIAKNTIFTDMVPEEDLPLILNAADVFVMPSLLTEVLPYTIIEAMAVCLPIITTKRPGNYEALGSSGIYVNIGDSRDMAKAMISIYKDSSFRENCAQENYKRFNDKFIMENLIDKWVDFLSDITGVP